MKVLIEITKHEWNYLNKLAKNGDILGHYKRLILNGTPMSNKGPCIHGNLCKEYWNKFHVIYSARCPKCDRYEPKS